jgi:hypothetical protein
MAILVQYEEKDVYISYKVVDKELYNLIVKLVQKGCLQENVEELDEEDEEDVEA